MTRFVRLLVFAASILALATPSRAEESVDLLLVLASDVSRSVDTRKFQLQREGYAAALSNPRVIDAIRSGPHGRIAICFVEWSGVTSQKLVLSDAFLPAPLTPDLASQTMPAARSMTPASTSGRIARLAAVG